LCIVLLAVRMVANDVT